MPNIVKELKEVAIKNAAKEIQEANKMLESVMDHLSEEDKQDSSMLQYFGTGQIVESEKRKIEAGKQRLKGEVLSIGDIESICMKYALRFLPAKQYKKEVPKFAQNDLRKYIKDNNIYEGYIDRNLFMIAPKSHFALGPRPKKDPVLILKNEESYTVVSQWGEDFSFSRRVFGWFKNEFGEQLMSAYILFACFIIGYSVFLTTQGEWEYLAFSILGGLGGVLVMVLVISSFDGTRNWDKKHK